MKLDQFIGQYPRSERATVRKRIAELCSVSPVTVKSWGNGTRNIRPEYFSNLTAATDGEVTIFDYHPDLPRGSNQQSAV